ncbi:MAG TPA: glycoside hydrolase family 3 N-terminal domain-containing protein [Solirubrobacteraceae bacterium]|nr:glycoside hydrolase family 3 N-terminal domain-containing protein [Solirubrobacteraceae bacterium]
MSALPPRARLGVLLAAVALVLAGAIWLLVLRGGDDEPVVEAGSRFGNEDRGGGGGSLLDTLTPVLGARRQVRSGGADPSAPSADDLRRAPGDAVAGLFAVGFRGTRPEGTFFERLGARPYGAVLLGNQNYEQPQQLAALTAKIYDVARDADHPAPIVAAPQEGDEFSAFPNLAPDGQVDVGARKTREMQASARAAGEQLKALGVGLTLAPNADVAVAGGPGQGRAFADTPRRVARAVKASVAGYREAGIASAVSPFPGDGAASQDPSSGPAPVGLGLEELRDGDMTPFQAVADGSGAAPAIQMSNAIYVAFDSVTPATLLPEAVKELRDRFGFEGTIVSADLVATTATTGGSVGDAAVAALKAGVDMLVVPGGRAQQDEAYRAVVAAVSSGAIPADRVVSSLKRIASLRRLTREAREPIQIDG